MAAHVTPAIEAKISAMRKCIHAMTEAERDRLIFRLIEECNRAAEFMAAVVRTAIVECRDSAPRDPRLLQALRPTHNSGFNLQQVEKHLIKAALVHAKGDKLVAAQLLGIGKSTLYRKLMDSSNGTRR